ncbi:MAG: hypothetical protein ABGX04_09815, partial [Myxococcales bacterium]
LRVGAAKAIFTQDVLIRAGKRLPLYEKVVAARAPRAIVLAAGEPVALAGALWLVLAARSLTAIPFVRDQVMQLHGRPSVRGAMLAGDVAALVAAAAAVALDFGVVTGAITLVAIMVYQRVSGRNPPSRAVVLGVRQTVIGLTVVLVTGLGVLAP